MMLIVCPECRRSVSDRAAACPQCGCPINESASEPLLRKHLRRRLSIAMVVCMAFIPIGLIASLKRIDYIAISVMGLIGFGIARARLRDLDS